jgi:competence protein ComEC
LYHILMEQKLIYRRILVLLVLGILCAVVFVVPKIDGVHFGHYAWFQKITGSGTCPAQSLCVTFLNIGQGDATLIESPTGTQMLIDGGRNSAVLRELGSVMGFWDRQLDYVLATHPDSDHVGGLIDVFERYQVDNIIRTDNESDSPAWRQTEKLMDEEGSVVFYAKRGQVYDLGGGAKLEILFPEIAMKDAESNTSSIVAKLTYGSSTFMLTGDSPKSIEEYLVLAEGEYLQSDVLKVGHHGSRTSTSEMFLEEVRPKYAVISSGKDNQYGHPHVEVTDLLFNKRVETFNTAEVGRVTFITDGNALTVR